MNYTEYEQYCADWWEKNHPEDTTMVTKKNPEHGGDGGIDVVIYSPDNGIKVAQCKHYFRDKLLRVGELKQLYSDMEMNGVKEGVFFSNIHFSQKCWEYRKKAEEKNKAKVYLKYLPDHLN